MLTGRQLLAALGLYKLLPTPEQMDALASAIDLEDGDAWLDKGLSNLDPTAQAALSKLVSFIIVPQFRSIPTLGTVDSNQVPGPILWPPEVFLIQGSSGKGDFIASRRDKTLSLGSGNVLDIVAPFVGVRETLIESSKAEDEQATVRKFNLTGLIFAWHVVRMILHYRAIKGEADSISKGLDADLLAEWVKVSGLQSDTWSWVRYLASIDIAPQTFFAADQNLQSIGLGVIAASEESMAESALSPFLNASEESEIYGLPSSVNSIASDARFGDPDDIEVMYNQVYLYGDVDGEDSTVTVSIVTKGTPEWRAIKAPYHRPIAATTNGLTRGEIDAILASIRNLALGLSTAVSEPNFQVVVNTPGYGATGEQQFSILTAAQVADLAGAAAVTAALFESLAPGILAAYRLQLDKAQAMNIPPRRALSFGDLVDFESKAEPTDPSTVPASKADFLSKALPLARATSRKYNIPVSVIIGQAIFESGWGKHSAGNNLFGIKKGSWTGETHIRVDDCNGCEFRTYADWASSFDDYGRLISSNYPIQGLPFDNTQWRVWLTAIASGGYASDSQYVTKVGEVITSNGLDQLGDDGTASITVPDTQVTEVETEVKKKPKRRKLLRAGD